MKLQKETKVDKRGHGRWYADACGTAFAMEMIGERWTLLIVRELMLGARRFSDLRASMPGISAKTLTDRLQALEENRVIVRRELPPPGKAQVYELTDWGYAAEPIIQVAGRWAAQSSAHDPTLPLSPVSLMMSLRTMVAHARLPQFARRTIGFAIGSDTFLVEPTARDLPIRRADVKHADAVFRAPDASIIAGGIYAGVPWSDLERDAGLAIEGNRDLAMRFVSLFKLPPKLA